MSLSCSPGTQVWGGRGISTTGLAGPLRDSIPVFLPTDPSRLDTITQARSIGHKAELFGTTLHEDGACSSC